MLEGDGEVLAGGVQAGHLEHGARVHVLQAAGPHARGHQGVEEGLAAEDVYDGGHLVGVAEGDELDQLAAQVRGLRHEVAVLLVGQRHEQPAVVAGVQRAARGLPHDQRQQRGRGRRVQPRDVGRSHDLLQKRRGHGQWFVQHQREMGLTKILNFKIW